MTVTAQSVLKHVSVDVLVDATNKKWKIDQLVRYLNRIQQLIGVWRPDAFIEKRTHTLVAGYRQTLPTGYHRALEFLSNTSGRAVSMPANGLSLMDAQRPSWRNDPQALEVLHVFYDVREPLAYLVWPPAKLGAVLDVKLQKAITPIAEPDPAGTWEDVTGDLSLVDDQLWQAVADGICYLAYAKDAQHAAQGARAMFHAQAMTTVLGIELKQAMEAGPKTDNASPAPAAS
jgi:hypothetical protein